VHFKYTNPLDGNPGLLKVAPSKVHHQYAITLTTPVFPNFNLLTCKVEAEMYLWKKSEGISSEPVPFYFQPTKVEKVRLSDMICNANVEEKKPLKRVFRAPRENGPQDQPSTGQIAVPPRRCKSGGGHVETIEPKKEQEEPIRVSEIIINAAKKEATATMNSSVQEELPAVNLDIKMLSQEMSKTSIGISNESGSKNHQQNSDLETPKVSLEELIKSF